MNNGLSPEFQAIQDEVDRITELPHDELVIEALRSSNTRWEAEFHHQLEKRTTGMAVDFRNRIFADSTSPNYAGVTAEESETWSALKEAQGIMEERIKRRRNLYPPSFIP